MLFSQPVIKIAIHTTCMHVSISINGVYMSDGIPQRLLPSSVVCFNASNRAISSLALPSLRLYFLRSAFLRLLAVLLYKKRGKTEMRF